MPELPEVETVVRGMRKLMVGHTFAEVTSRAPVKSITISRTLGSVKIGDVLRGKTVETVTRRGKNILVALSGDVTLWIHLKMTGRVRHMEIGAPHDKHDLVFFDFAALNGEPGLHVRFNDYRRFGRLRIFPDSELWRQPGLADLGPEPLELPADDFAELCMRRPRMIKPTLLDQSFIAGLGNIYADESLYASRIHPKRLTTSLSRRKLIELHGHIQRLLRKSIQKMGTTSDTYSGVNGKPGSFQQYLLVYDREGEACDRCGAMICREKIGSRSAHYCPRCQRVG